MTLIPQASGVEQLQLATTRCQPVLTVARDPLPPAKEPGKLKGGGEAGTGVKEKGLVGAGAGAGGRWWRCCEREEKPETRGAKRFGCLFCLP